jgi:hypothetical protein
LEQFGFELASFFSTRQHWAGAARNNMLEWLGMGFNVIFDT